MLSFIVLLVQKSKILTNNKNTEMQLKLYSIFNMSSLLNNGLT